MPEMPPPFARPMTPADLDAAMYVRRTALSWLLHSQGEQPWPWDFRRPPHHAHLLETDPGGAWAVTVGGTMTGYAMALMRGDWWYLSQLFVHPESHGSDGGKLALDSAWQYGVDRGARIFAVSASSSRVAQALYMRQGMMTFGVTYDFSGPVDALCALPDAGDSIRELPEHVPAIDALDERNLGVVRPQDHALYRAADPSDAPVVLALDRGRGVEAYAYVSSRGVAPMSAERPEDQLLLLRAAGDWLAKHDASNVSIPAVSHNATVLPALLRAGWRINGQTYLMATEPFGRFDRHVPSGGLML